MNIIVLLWQHLYHTVQTKKVNTVTVGLNLLIEKVGQRCSISCSLFSKGSLAVLYDRVMRLKAQIKLFYLMQGREKERKESLKAGTNDGIVYQSHINACQYRSVR